MSPLSGKQESTELERWLQEAREGSGESLRKTLAVCREYLATIAAEELPAGPGRGAVAQYLANSAFIEVQKLLPTFQGGSEEELHEWLRQILLEQTSAMPGRERQEGLGNFSTPDPGSVNTKSPGTSAPQDPGPQAANQPIKPVGQSEGVAHFASKTTEEMDRTLPAARDDGSVPMLSMLEGFEIGMEIARGGMGIVYRAWQERLQRWVALKCLPPAFAEDPERLRRFRQEARLAAQLTEPGIVQVFDVLEAGNTPILVLPYIEGSDLARIIAQRRALREGQAVPDPHPWAMLNESDYLSRILPFFDKVLDALVRLHGAGILHRDLKPSNILVDKNGNGWLTDFGLARLSHFEPATRSGQGVGTRGFMSPEQWDGDQTIDARTDVFGMGVTLYQAVTLELPYGKQRITADTPPAHVSKTQQRRLPANLDLVLKKAIQPDRRRRYESAADLRDDWQRVRGGSLPAKAPVARSRRWLHAARSRRGLAVAGLTIVALSVALATTAIMWRGDATGAAPNGPAEVKRIVHLETEPAGARVVLIPINPQDGSLQMEKALRPEKPTPLILEDVPASDYLVVVDVKDYGFHEVLRRVPPPGGTPAHQLPHLQFNEQDDGSVGVPLITVPKLDDVVKGMAYFHGGEFVIGAAKLGIAPLHKRSVNDFLLDTTEVTVGEYRRVMGGIPSKLASSTPEDDEAVRWVSFDQAVYCAETLGKRLPDEFEYEVAATGGQDRPFPWGEDRTRIVNWPIGKVRIPDYDQTADNPPVFGLFSNVAEWTSSWLVPYPDPKLAQSFGSPEMTEFFHDMRVVRGGPTCVWEGAAEPQGKDKSQVWDARWREGVSRNMSHSGLGFRCARSARPRGVQSSKDPPK